MSFLKMEYLTLIFEIKDIIFDFFLPNIFHRVHVNVTFHEENVIN